MSLCSNWSDFVHSFLTEVVIWCGGVSFDGCWQLFRSVSITGGWQPGAIWLREAQNSTVEKYENKRVGESAVDLIHHALAYFSTVRLCSWRLCAMLCGLFVPSFRSICRSG